MDPWWKNRRSGALLQQDGETAIAVTLTAHDWARTWGRFVVSPR